MAIGSVFVGHEFIISCFVIVWWRFVLGGFGGDEAGDRGACCG
jgi:hypothetical protein